MNNRGLLIVVIVLLAAVAGLIVMDRGHVERTDGPMEKLSNSVNEVTEEIKDEIDDNTTSPNR